MADPIPPNFTTPQIKLILRYWGEDEVPFRKDKCLERLKVIQDERGEFDWEEVLDEAQKDAKVDEQKALISSVEKVFSSKLCTMKEEMEVMRENLIKRADGKEREIHDRIERLENENLKLRSLLCQGPSTEPSRSVTCQYPMEFPKLCDYPTVQRFLAAFKLLTSGVPCQIQSSHLLTQLGPKYPDLIKEGEDYNIETISEKFKCSEGETKRCEELFYKAKWSGKESLEQFIDRLEAYAEQAFKEQSKDEIFNKVLEAFWNTTKNSQIKKEFYRITEKCKSKDTFFLNYRRAERIDAIENCSTWGLNGVETNTERNEVQEGHVIPRNNRRKVERGSVYCYVCNYTGHLAESCSLSTCYSCGRKGHFARNCTYSGNDQARPIRGAGTNANRQSQYN